SSDSYRLANFRFLPAISQPQLATLVRFPLSRQAPSSLYVDEQSPLLSYSSLERRRSSRTFRSGYLVTTSPQSFAPPSAAGSIKWLPHRLRGLLTRGV